ncbi:MAG TPA: hypothetical protein VE650_21415 [Acetobacteraceae bacterium]|nr:hypothetical protein [Acetobacteraceae bacterium]
MTLKTPSPDPKPATWCRFVLSLVATFAGGSAALFVLLALLDPWGAMPFRSPLPRTPADHSQRWAYPELARDPRFDAAIIGNSASRLLDPAAIDPVASARFVNLAMVHAFAYEQARLLDVFIAAHPRPRAVLVGLDRVWCERGTEFERYGYGPIPDWLYDGDRLAALGNLLNLRAIETALRSFSAKLGLSPAPYGDNGYALIGVDFHKYDPALAKRLIAQDLAITWPEPPNPDPATWRYGALEWLAARLDRLPAGTRKILVFVPVHHLYPAPGSPGAAMMAECKRRVVAMARERPNAEVIDFSIPSPVTTEEDRWWDGVHARPETMARVSAALARALAHEETEDVHILTPRPGLAENTPR